MAGFKFKDRIISVEIEGISFKFIVTTKLGDALNKFSVRALSLAERAKSEQIASQEMTDVCKEVIDTVLGDGAYSRISEVREMDAYDCIDLIQYLTNEVRAQRRG